MITPKENLMRIFNHEMPEYVPDSFTDIWYAFPREVLERGPMTTEAEIMAGTGGGGYDWFGVHWTFVEEVGAATPSHALGHEPILKDVTEWKDVIKFPDLDAIDWKAAAERDMNDEYNPYDPSKLGHLTIQNGPFERLHACMGVEEALVALLLEPDAVRDFSNAIMDYKIELIDKITEYYPIDVVEIMDDFGHENNAFMSVEDWEYIYAPGYKKVVDFCNSKGIKFQLHSCGKVESLIPSFLNVGIHHWASCQLCNDLTAILHEYGKELTLWPVTTFPQFQGFDPDMEEVKAVLKEKVLDHFKGGAYIAGVWDMNPKVQEALATWMAENRETFYQDPANCVLP